ncbi:peptidase M4, partial [Pseudomonas sp. HMWF021]
MKTLTALFTAAALTLTAGLAQADVRVDQIPQLVKEGKIKSLESMNAEALKL